MRHEELKNYIAKHTNEKAIIRLPGPKWAYGLAASLLLFAAAFFLFHNQIPENVNPIAIFKPKDKIKVDTLSEEDNNKIQSSEDKITTFESDPIMSELEEDADSINYDNFDQGDISDEDIEIEVRQDKIIRTQSAFTITHVAKQLKDTVEDKISSATPTIAKNELESISEKKSKNVEIKVPAATSTDDKHIDEVSKDKTSKVLIEFWESIVGYKGYKWNGKTLRLYGLDSTSNVEIHHLDKNYYLQINKDYFLLRLTDNYESYVKITDAALIERLKK